VPKYTLDLWHVVEFDAPDDSLARLAGQAASAAIEAHTGGQGARAIEHEVEVRRKVGRAQVMHKFAGAEAA
jgi:hypothetical protein